MKQENIFSKTLITGGDGMVASAFDFGEKLNKSDLDITDRSQCEKIFSQKKPFLVIHLAALTDMAECEKDPALAYEVNVLGAYNIAKTCRDYGSKLVYLSTGAVFDNSKNSYSEDDAPRPLNVYGRTKYAGELIVNDIVPNHIIIRTGWLFGGGPNKDRHFTSKIIKQLNDGNEIKAISDRFGCPTYINDLAAEIKKLIVEDKSGLFHVVNAGSASYYEWAGEIARVKGSSVKITAVHAAEFRVSAPRARSEVMVSDKLAPLRSWQEALEEYLEKEW